jgi:hypothetical protein
VLELLDPSPQPAGFLLYGIEVLRQLHQALIRDDALDPSHAGIEITKFDLYWIILRGSGCTTAQNCSDCNSDGSWQQ